MRTLAFTFLLSLGWASATPAQEAKAVLGGVISDTVVKSVGNTQYLLAVQSPYQNGENHLYLLKPFAGKYAIVWHLDLEKDDFVTAMEDVDIADANQDGQPEVFFSYLRAGNHLGTELYKLYDTAGKKLYSVEVNFSWGGSTGDISIDPQLEKSAATPFLKFLEGKVAGSKYLQDNRNASAQARDAWFEQYGGFFKRDAGSPPLRIRGDWKPFTDEACRSDGSVNGISRIGNTEYRSYFQYGLVAFNQTNHQCALLLGYELYNHVRQQTVVNGEVRITFENGSIAAFQPSTGTARWVRR